MIYNYSSEKIFTLKLTFLGRTLLDWILEQANSICYNANRQNDESVQVTRKQKPPVFPHWRFFIPFGQGGLNHRLTTAYHLCPAICKCSRRLHLPKQRSKTMKVNPRDTPPSCTCLGVVACKLYHVGDVNESEIKK